MLRNERSRREFLRDCGVVSGGLLLSARLAEAAGEDPPKTLHVASNQFTWMTYFRRDKRDFNASLDEGLAEVAQCKLDGLEPLLGAADDVDRLAPLLKKHGLEMRSLYTGAPLHDASQVDATIQKVVGVAKKAKAAGTRILVVNPASAANHGEKTAEELATQADAMTRLGRELRALGVTLAYHHHSPAMRSGARELRHVLDHTDPEAVTYCFDVHWVYRGSGNSLDVVADVLQRYGSRASELHLRQSKDGIWSETFGEGDLDYSAVAEHLLRIDVKPHLVLEQAVEKGTPHTLTALEANRQSCQYIRRLFAGFAGY
ncbi:MAG: sugar phosphate isomerase/epimerase family protein [Planctomycetota bacterium]|jgi:inosose dehydratase